MRAVKVIDFNSFRTQLDHQNVYVLRIPPLTILIAVPGWGLWTEFQHLDAFIAATYSEGDSLYDACKALAPKFKEPDAIVSVDRVKDLLILFQAYNEGIISVLGEYLYI